MKIKKGAELQLDIESAAFKGKGIAKINGLAIFVPNTAPGDRIKARITKKKSSYCEAQLIDILKEGPNRITPRCKHAGVCGGCSWQHVSYKEQLSFKQDQVRDHMHRIGGLTHLKVSPTIGCEQPFNYRNKMEYSVGHKRRLSQDEIDRDEFVSPYGFAAGLHAPGRYDVILDISECHLQDPISYQILDFVRSWCIERDITPYNPNKNKGFLRNVVIRKAHYTDDLMANIVTYQDDQAIMEPMCDAIRETFPSVTTIINNINDRKNPTAMGRYEHVLYGPGYITEHLGPYHFRIDANAFFQTNTLQAEKLYSIAVEFADVQAGDTVYDLYCGVGSLSLFLSNKAKQVVGIELEEVALQNAQKNASENNVENVNFVQGDMKDVFTEEITAPYGSPDCLITDPPRAGMHPDVVSRLNELQIPKLVYISCNSSTMARDLKKLSKTYDILEVQPVDMFPQTYHIETVAKLRLKK